jgi:hypothetical protein
MGPKVLDSVRKYERNVDEAVFRLVAEWEAERAGAAGVLAGRVAICMFFSAGITLAAR